MKTMQKGFTLIELIVVIVILGILAATALPKFIDLSGDARKAVLKGVAGSMASANALIYAKAASTGTMGTTSAPVQLSGVGDGTVKVAYGFADSVGSLVKMMDLTPADDFDSTSTAGEIRYKNAPTPGDCKVVYTPATSTTVPPSYVITDTGC